MNASTNTVRIDQRLIHRISVRERGLPSMRMPGKIWRSEQCSTVTCMTRRDDTNVNIETLPLIIVEPGERQWMPKLWQDALWEYAQAWPLPGYEYGPFLAIGNQERCAFLRQLGATLVDSDDIGCHSIANMIGMFAAYGYEPIGERL